MGGGQGGSRFYVGVKVTGREQKLSEPDFIIYPHSVT